MAKGRVSSQPLIVGTAASAPNRAAALFDRAAMGKLGMSLETDFAKEDENAT